MDTRRDEPEQGDQLGDADQKIVDYASTPSSAGDVTRCNCVISVAQAASARKASDIRIGGIFVHSGSFKTDVTSPRYFR